MAHIVFSSNISAVAFMSMAEGLAGVQQHAAEDATATAIYRATARAEANTLARLADTATRQFRTSDTAQTVVIDDADASAARDVYAAALEAAHEADADDCDVMEAGGCMVLDGTTATPVEALAALVEWCARAGGFDAPEWHTAREALALVRMTESNA